MTFEEWKKQVGLPDLVPCLVSEAWQAATLAERERAAKVALLMPVPGFGDDMKHDGYEMACEDISAAICKGEGV